MVRKVHLCHDDEFAGFERPDCRPDFDGLDDLIFEGKETPQNPPTGDRWPASHRPHGRKSPRDPRRHLADADWLPAVPRNAPHPSHD